MSNDNRGLASADEKTRKRIASEGGKPLSRWKQKEGLITNKKEGYIF
jgi:hypothetical protein